LHVEVIIEHCNKPPTASLLGMTYLGFSLLDILFRKHTPFQRNKKYFIFDEPLCSFLEWCTLLFRGLQYFNGSQFGCGDGDFTKEEIRLLWNWGYAPY
jgi:hypothetical protein